jgi:sodium/potassium/calcium exchanger 5
MTPTFPLITNATIDYSTTNPSEQCIPASINDFPTDLFTQTQRRFGGVIFHFIFAVYLFFAITRVCDDYFMSSLEIISEVIILQNYLFSKIFLILV